MNGHDGVLDLHTADGVTLSLPLAGLVTRSLALAVDMGAILVGTTVVSWIARLMSAISADVGVGLMFLAQFAIGAGYAIVAEWLYRGQTLGKRMMRIRVIDIDGGSPSLAQIVVRNVLRPVDMLPVAYLVGGAFALSTRLRQRLGDIAANTVVVHIPRTLAYDLDSVLPGKYNSLRQSPHLAARLRQHTDGRMARVALMALMRRDELTPEARVKVFGELADSFRDLVTFPPEYVDTLSDEQYVRNVVDVLLRSDTSAMAR